MTTNSELAVIELINAAKDIRDNPGADCHGTVGFCAIELPKLARLRYALAAVDLSVVKNKSYPNDCEHFKEFD